MRAFILISLADRPSQAYGQLVLQEVKQLPAGDLAVLDLDAFSEEMLINYARRLIQEAEAFVVYFKVENENAAFGTSLKIVEEIIRHFKPGLILIEGHHQRLQTIMQSRPHLACKSAATAVDLKPYLVSFLTQAV